jgi:predicted esterase
MDSETHLMSGETIVRAVKTAVHGRVLIQHAVRPSGILLGFHGYAETAEIQLQRLAEIDGAWDWTRVSIQGLNRFYRGRFQETIACWMTRQDREVAIADNIEYVNAAIDTVTDGAHQLPVVCVGFSQGVAMAFRGAVRGRVKCAGVIALGGDVPPELLQDPAARFPAVLLARGANDDFYTQAKLDADVAALQARNTDVRAIVFDGAHEWTPEFSREAGQFLFAFRA